MEINNNIIKIENKDGIQTVNAWELWSLLEVETAFKNWIIRQIEKYGFKDGVDVRSFLTVSSGGLQVKGQYRYLRKSAS